MDDRFAMTRMLFVRIVGSAQLVFSVLLVITMSTAYSTYRSSMGDMSRSLAASILSISNVVSQVAVTIRLRQEVLDETANALKKSRKTVEEIGLAAQKQDQLLRQYASSVESVSAILSRVGNTVTRIGDGLLFSVPNGAHMEGVKPVLNWYKPLEDQSRELKAHGQDLKNLGVGVKNIADTINNDGPKLSAAFLDASRQTLVLIDVTTKSMDNLNLEDLPRAVKELEATSISLREASNQASGIEQFAVSLLVVGFVLAILFALNGIGFLLFATSFKSSSDDSLAAAEANS